MKNWRKKLIRCSILGFVFVLLSLLLFQKSEIGEETQLSQDIEQTNVLNAQSSQINISAHNSFGFGGGLISFASTDEPSVDVSGYNISGSAEVSLYDASIESVLDYLTHDKDGKQIKQKFDLTRFRHVNNFTFQITSSDGKGSKLLLPIGQQGIWYLTIKIGTTEASKFIVRSNTGILNKEGNNEYIFWGQNFKTQRSISKGTLKLYNLLNKSSQLTSIAFDSEGIAKAPFFDNADIALFEDGEDVSVIPINLRYLNIGSSYRYFQTQSQNTKYFVFTDRPLYRPGDTVYFKAILRNDDDASYSIPKGEVEVKIFPGWDDKDAVFKRSFSISDDGTINGEYKLTEDASKGGYGLKIQSPNPADFGSTTYFNVEYVRKPDYFINISALQSEIIAGDKTSFKISGNYFSGQPLSKQKVKYKVISSDFYQYEHFSDRLLTIDENFAFGAWYGENITEGEVELNNKGEAKVDLNAKFPSGKNRNQVFSIEAEFDDGSGNPSFARKNILVYAAYFDIFRKDYKSSGKVGEQLALSIILSSHRESPLLDVPLKVKIHRENWVPTDDKGKYTQYRKEEEDFPEINTKTENDGSSFVNFNPLKVGLYTFTVEGKDYKGNITLNKFSYYVSKDEQFTYFDNNGSNISITADKNKYFPGDTAHLTISSKLPERDVFLSLEKGRVNRFQIVHISGNLAKIDMPITGTDMPNIYAKASSFSKSDLDNNLVNLSVSTETKKINITLKTDQKKYAPGDLVSMDILTNDSAGKPVSANLAVWAVDKALFELTDQKFPNIFSDFWRERYDGTTQSHSLEGIHAFAGGGGGGGGGGRSVFKDTAYWNPEVHTDTAGRAKISFKLPDNLTTWTVTAIGSTSDTSVGEGSSEVLVSKDIVVRPILPNILRVGDEIKLSALLQNFSQKDETFNVKFKFDEGEVKVPEQTIFVKAGDLQKINWIVFPKSENEKAKLSFEAISTEDKKIGDMINIGLPVKNFGFWEKRVENKVGSVTLPIKLLPDSDDQKSKVTLSFSQTLTGNLINAFDYLIDYPYGCVEQTMSRLVPALIVKQNPDLFTNMLKDKNLNDITQRGFNRLSELQHSDGGWSFWYSQPSDPFITAYVFENLIMAKQVGLKVNDQMIIKAQRFFENNNPKSNSDQALKIYALSLTDSEKGKTIISKFDDLSPDLLSMAVIANIRNGEKDSNSNGLRKLLSISKIQGDGIYWEGGTKEHFGSRDASSALALKALLEAGTEQENIIKAGRFLTRSRSSNYWSNTFGTSEVVSALIGFSKTQKEVNPNYSYQVFLDDKEIGNGKVTDSKQMINSIDIPVSDINTNGSNIIVKQTGVGQLYSNLGISEFHTDKNAKALDHGLVVKREYISDKGEEYSLAVGDIVTVKITLSGLSTEENYGIIEDELPSGLIPINQSFNNQEFQQDKESEDNVSDREVTENGMILSLNKITPEEKTYTYKARAVNVGTFIVPPVKASLMYAPEIYGRSGVQTIKVTESSEIIPGKVINQKPSSLFDKNKIIRVAFTILPIFLLIVIVFFFRKKVLNLSKIKEAIQKKLKKDNKPPTPPVMPNPPVNNF